MSEIELKACPWCGRAPEVSRSPTGIGNLIMCNAHFDECPATPAVDEGTMELAARAWNTRAPQWQPIEFNEDGEPTNVEADMPVLVPPTKRLGMTVAKWNPLDGWETETCSDWIGMYRPTHFQLLPDPPEVEG